MSAKLIYSLSDDKPNLQKQIGCMNGFLQFFDRRHFINIRSINRRLPHAGENSRQEREVKTAGSCKRSKEKHKMVAKEMQRKAAESTRASFSSSTGSTTMSSREYDSTTKSEQSPFRDTTSIETNPWDCRVSQPHFSPYRTHSSPNKNHQIIKNHVDRNPIYSCESPIRTATRQQVVCHINSPKLLRPFKLDSPRPAALNESFHSISSSQSDPVTPLKKKDPAQMLVLKHGSRLSYDGSETRERFLSGSKFGDFPRLSLDSKQRRVNRSICESRKDLLLKDMRREMQCSSQIEELTEEPSSYRPPSNIVVKLMGLDALPDCTPTPKKPIDPDDFSKSGRLHSLSTSSRTIDESKVSRVLDSPRNSSKNSGTLRSSKAELVVKPSTSIRISTEPSSQKHQTGNPHFNKADLKYQEVHAESQEHSLTLYGEIEKKLAHIDFEKSGKDLRALKQILEAIHREKAMQGGKNEKQPSSNASEMSCSKSSNTQQIKCQRKVNPLPLHTTCPLSHSTNISRHPEDAKPSRVTKPGKLVNDSRKGATRITQDIPPQKLQQLRINQATNSALKSVDKKAGKHTSPGIFCSQKPARPTLCITGKDSEAKAPKQTTSEVPQKGTKRNIIRTATISGTASLRMCSTKQVAENHHHAPTTTSVSRTKRYNQQSMGPQSPNQKQHKKSFVYQDSDDQSSELSTDSTCHSRQRNTFLLFCESNNSSVRQTGLAITNTDLAYMKHRPQQQIHNNRSPERIQGEESSVELSVDVKEQPSPVSVLDAKFYGDESPSPVKKKPTVFTAFADDDTISTATELEWKGIGTNDSPCSLRPSFSCNSDYQRLETFKQSALTLPQLNNNRENEKSATGAHKDVNLDKAYVTEILLASGFLDFPNFNEVNHHVYPSKEAINPNLSFFLEQAQGNRDLSGDETKAKRITGTHAKHRRRLMFDVVNEILFQKLSSMNVGSGFKTGQQLLQEILKKVEQLQEYSFHQNVDDEDNYLTIIIERDLARKSAWTDANSEKSGLVLDVERLIFKDLIADIVHDSSSL